MAFRGLFIGIDRYASVDISWLSCAVRDATALQALFSDTLGSDTVLLTDEHATRAAIAEQFTQLASCDPDDVVVITFSGHGSETHELVTHDADIHNLATSCIPLDTLTEWFSQIPARRLICILDCCFSGGMGAKVLQVPIKARDLASTEHLLDQLSGDGRLIFTASTANEPAWENSRVGHGLLTYFLLEALQGAEEVRIGGKISVYRLLEYVTQRVVASAGQLGEPQHPTLRGQLDGALTWPVFQPGPLYRAAFPERGTVQITPDIASLAAYGFPSELLRTWAGSIPSLNSLQLDAINGFNLLRGDHLVVSAPTSSGKTMIGELAALKGALERKRALFLLPMRALVNDKHQQFNRTYGAFGVRTIRATGEITDEVPDLLRGRYDLCLLTYEKFGALILTYPHILSQVGTIVVDEVQMLADPSRGANLEFILTLLRMQRRQSAAPQLIALSAVIGDTNGLERWLDARLLRRNDRPVPLDEGVLRADGSFRYLDPAGQEQILPAFVQRQWGRGSNQDWVIPLVRRLVSEGKQVIVFREIKGEAQGCALYLARELGLPPAQTALDALPSGDPSGASHDLRTALAGGVAFHNRNLDREERAVVEEQFRAPDSAIRVITATTTLAMGVNTPASAVVIVGLAHPGPVPQPYTVAEYKNIVGRAGRLGFAEHGTSYLLALSPQDEHYAWSHYVHGVPEDLESRFLDRGTDPRTVIVRVLIAARRSSANRLPAEAIIDFLENSFGAFQREQAAPNWTWNREQLVAALRNLEHHRLVEQDGAGGYSLTALGSLAGEGWIEVESITRLVDTLAQVSVNALTDTSLVAAAQLTVELDNQHFPMNKRSTNKEPYAWRAAMEQQQVHPAIIAAFSRAITDPQQATLRAKKAAACLLWITPLPLAEIEQRLTQFGGRNTDAAGEIRAVASRTCDILPAVVRVAELIHPDLNLADRHRRLLTRMEAGVPPAAVDLAAYAGGRLSRADYHRLLQADLCSIDNINAATDETLIPYLGTGQRGAEKLQVLRAAVRAYHQDQAAQMPMGPLLPPYES